MINYLSDLNYEITAFRKAKRKMTFQIMGERGNVWGFYNHLTNHAEPATGPCFPYPGRQLTPWKGTVNVVLPALFPTDLWLNYRDGG
jgi:hypothetical protein